jgi:hypothetical protein
MTNKKAIAFAKELISYIDRHIDEIGDNGVEFFNSVKGSLTEMAEGLEEKDGDDMVSDGKQRALANWDTALGKWVR